jgi:hypothetical protein
VVATPVAIVNVIKADTALACIDSAGIGQSLIAKIDAYQKLASGGHLQGAKSVLTAFQYEVQVQNGHHIKTKCTDPVGGDQFSPLQTLIAHAQSLQSALGDPVVGSVVNASDAGISGATVDILRGKTILATTTTDAMGFYYFGDLGSLAPGANYTVKVTPPKGYKSSTPASQTFTWSAAPMKLGDFLLN